MTVLDAPPVGLSALTLTEPLPGFPGHRDFALVPAAPEGLVHWLRSVAADGPRFLVVPATAFFPEYAPALPRGLAAELGLSDPREAALFCIVTVSGGDARAATANLRAPLVVNRRCGRARQVVLADATHPIRRPLRR